MADTAKKRAKNSIEIQCRACLAKICDDSCVDLFRAWDPPWSGMGVSIAEDLIRLANIQISVSDPYAKNICKKCCNRLQDAISFTWNVQNSDILLRKRHEECTNEIPSWPKPIKVDKNLTSDAFNEMHVEVKQEVMSEDEYEMNESYSEPCEPRLDIKIEPEEITPAPPSIVIEVNGPFSLSQGTKELPNGATEYLEEGMLHEIKAEPKSDDETESMLGMPMDCMLCMKTFNTVKGLKAHVISVHSYDNFTPPRVDRTNVCSTCNRSFSTRTDLFVHETCHSKFACYVCDKKFDTFLLLTKHRNKQCMKTSILPRLKTLDDVRRPIYYINDKNKSPLTNSAPKNNDSNISPKKQTSLDSEATIEPNQSPVKTNSSVEPLLSEIKQETQENVQLEESANEDTISVDEKTNLRALVEETSETIEKTYVSEKTNPGVETEIETDLNKISETNNQQPDQPIKTLRPEESCPENFNNTEHTQRQEPIDSACANEDIENASKNIEQQLNTSLETSKLKNDIGPESNNEMKENITKVDNTVAEVRQTEKCFIEINNEKLKIKSAVSNETTEIDSEIINETKDIHQAPLCKTEDNFVKKSIQQQLLETCANNEPSTDQIDSKEQNAEQNHKTEKCVELPSEQYKTLQTQSDIAENMEIQLEIHSMDKEQDNAMEIDNDLEREIKIGSESDKTQ